MEIICPNCGYELSVDTDNGDDSVLCDCGALLDVFEGMVSIIAVE